MGIQPDPWRRVADAVTDRMASMSTPIDQAGLVRLSGLSDQFVRAIMRGTPRGEPRETNLRRLAVALGWTPDSIERILAGGEPIMNGSVDTAAHDAPNIIPGDVLLDRFLQLEAKVDLWATRAEERGSDVIAIRADCEAVRDDVTAIMVVAASVTAALKELSRQSAQTLEILAEIQQAVG